MDQNYFLSAKCNQLNFYYSITAIYNLTTYHPEWPLPILFFPVHFLHLYRGLGHHKQPVFRENKTVSINQMAIGYFAFTNLFQQ